MPEVHSHLLAFIVHNPSFDAYSWPREAPTVWTNLKIVMLPAGHNECVPNIPSMVAHQIKEPQKVQGRERRAPT